MKIDSDTYVNVEAICERYGTDACKILPAFHSITGCDTSSYPYRVGKVRPWKKLLKAHAYDLLSTFGHGIPSPESLSLAKEFLRTIMYDGQRNESYIETRVRMYQKQKVKSSESLIPDENSTLQHLKRSWYQCFIWLHCLQDEIPYPDIDEDFGWSEQDGLILPVWYTCNQFPMDLTDIKKRTVLNGE